MVLGGGLPIHHPVLTTLTLGSSLLEAFNWSGMHFCFPTSRRCTRNHFCSANDGKRRQLFLPDHTHSLGLQIPCSPAENSICKKSRWKTPWQGIRMVKLAPRPMKDGEIRAWWFFHLTCGLSCFLNLQSHCKVAGSVLATAFLLQKLKCALKLTVQNRSLSGGTITSLRTT